jgi:hypothetical protein
VIHEEGVQGEEELSVISDVYEASCTPGSLPVWHLSCHLQLRVLEKTEIEKRLGKLERLMREGIMETRKESAAEEMRKGLNPGPDREAIKACGKIDGFILRKSWLDKA